MCACALSTMPIWAPDDFCSSINYKWKNFTHVILINVAYYSYQRWKWLAFRFQMHFGSSFRSNLSKLQTIRRNWSESKLHIKHANTQSVCKSKRIKSKLTGTRQTLAHIRHINCSIVAGELSNNDEFCFLMVIMRVSFRFTIIDFPVFSINTCLQTAKHGLF